MVKYYMGFDWCKKRYEMNTYPYTFVSAGVAWSKTCGKKLAIFKFNNAEDIMLDCGGFSFFSKYSEYPFPLKDYVDWIKKMNEENNNKVTYVATRDYPCEPDINRANLMTNKERMVKSVENAVECMEYDELEINCRWLPVLQGYTKEEYLDCLDLYKKSGCLGSYLAIGSMCRRTDINEIENILRAIRREYGGKLHLFGLTLNALKSKFIVDNIFSCDSIGYTFNCNTFDETVIKSQDLINKFHKLNYFHKGQTVLDHNTTLKT